MQQPPRETQLLVDQTLRTLKRVGTRRAREGMARYGLVARQAFGVSVADLHRLAAQMERWARDFENWGDCDTVIMHLFDRTPHAWKKVDTWCGRQAEFVKRAGFAMVASLALHDKTSPDSRFVAALALVEREAGDERNFVKKAVNWALRSVGSRNAALHAHAVALATKLAAAEESTPRWIGKDALRQLATPATRKRLARAASKS